MKNLSKYNQPQNITSNIKSYSKNRIRTDEES